jgi:hypothetical protein
MKDKMQDGAANLVLPHQGALFLNPFCLTECAVPGAFCHVLSDVTSLMLSSHVAKPCSVSRIPRIQRAESAYAFRRRHIECLGNNVVVTFQSWMGQRPVLITQDQVDFLEFWGFRVLGFYGFRFLRERIPLERKGDNSLGTDTNLIPVSHVLAA